MDTRVKLIFDKNPKQEEVYQIIGSNRYFKEKKNALEAVFGNENDLQTHKRADYYEVGARSQKSEAGSQKPPVKKAVPTKSKKTTPKKEEGQVVIPEGTPVKDWKVDEIKAWMDREGVKYTSKDNEGDLLAKVEEHLKQNDNPQKPE
jgi:hypothetical protein